MKTLKQTIQETMELQGGFQIKNPNTKIIQMEEAVSLYIEKRVRILLMVLLGIFLLGMTACAPAGSSSDGGQTPNNGVTCGTLAGNYYAQNDPSITMTATNSCTFTDSVCGYQASYTVPNYQSGATVVTIANTNGAPGCMSNTAHACTMTYNGVQLAINCDSGAHQFLFIRQ